jgi:hypothetical protein
MTTANSSSRQTTSLRRFASAVALALVGGEFCGPMVQASGYGGIVTWLLFIMVLALMTSLLTDRLHYLVSGFVALVGLGSVEIAGLISYSRHGGDAGAEFRRNLDVMAIMFVVGLITATAATLLVTKWRRR